MADELIDIYDVGMNYLGTAMKSQAHAEGLWHKSFYCWIVKPSKDGKHKVWLQLRGKDKELYPNLLDTSVAGHIQAGEKNKDAAREGKEEIGIEILPEKLTKLFTYVITDKNKLITNNEFAPTYLFETSAKLEDLVMQEEEVDGVFEAVISELIDLFSNKVSNIETVAMYRNKEKRKEVVSITDFCPREEYYLKVFDALTRYCNGVIK